MINEIKDLDRTSVSMLSMSFFSMLGPGFLVLFLYQRDLFVSLETIKLIILSIAVTMPGVIVPIIFCVFAQPIINKMLEGNVMVAGTMKEWFYKQSFNNAMNLYVLLFVSYAFSISFITFSILYAIAIIACTLFEIWHMAKVANYPEKKINIELP